MSKVQVLYRGSSGNAYILNMTSQICRIKDGNFHKWQWTPDAVARQYGVGLRSFKHEPALYEVTLAFGGPLATRKTRIEALHDEWERDIATKSPGRITWGLYYLDCYVIKSSTYPDSKGWYTLNDITIYAPDPLWRRETTYTITTIPSTGYPVRTAVPWEVDFRMTLTGPCTIYPMVTLSDSQGNVLRTYLVQQLLDTGERITIDSEAKTVTYYDANNAATDIYAKCDPETIFKKIPVGNLLLKRRSGGGNFAISLTTCDRRSEPKQA